MTTTYCDDTDITARESQATELNLGSTDFSAHRLVAYNEIGRRIARRNPGVNQAGLGIVEELREAEVRFTLYRLYFTAASRCGDDMFWQKSQAYKREFEEEIAAVELPVATVPSRGSIPVRRS